VNEEFEVAELLVEEGAKAERAGELADVGEMTADVGIGKRFGSPLHVATLVGNTKIITLLLGHLEDKDANSTCELAGIGGNGHTDTMVRGYIWNSARCC
jgi:hypothetical protein